MEMWYLPFGAPADGGIHHQNSTKTAPSTSQAGYVLYEQANAFPYEREYQHLPTPRHLNYEMSSPMHHSGSSKSSLMSHRMSIQKEEAPPRVVIVPPSFGSRVAAFSKMNIHLNQA